MKFKKGLVNFLIFIGIPSLYILIHVYSSDYWESNEGGSNKAKAFSLPLIRESKSHNFKNFEKVNLESFKGKPLLINFWASWCTTCEKEEGTLKDLWIKYGQKGAVQFFGVATMDNKEDVLKSKKRTDIKQPVALDESGEVAQIYNVKSIPQSFLVDAKGRICKRVNGPILSASLIQMETAIEFLIQNKGLCP